MEKIKEYWYVILVIFLINFIYQMIFEFPILQKQLKDEQKNLDEQHAQQGTAFSSERIENNKILKIKHKKETLLFWVFSVIFPINLLEKIRKMIWK